MNEKINNIKTHIINMHPILKEIVENRKIDTPISFFSPNLSVFCENKMSNIIAASYIVKDGIKSNKRFSIYYDVDVDGITAGTIMYQYLKCFDIDSNIIINKGKDHEVDINKVPEDTEILIIVDSLLNNYEKYYELANKGIKIIILDHHEVEQYPDHKNVVLVTSNKNYENKYLSGAGVVYKFCLELDGLFETYYSCNFMDLAACGIIADIMSMKSLENRAICRYGFENIRNEFLKYLLKNNEFDSKFVSWTLAPLINSLNRANKNQLAIDLFLCEDKNKLKILIEKAKIHKNTQDKIVEKIIKNEQNSFFGLNYQNKKYKFLSIQIPLEYQNYTGLIANKILDIYNKPTIVTAFNDEEGKYCGSMRANGINFMEEINNCLIDKNDYCKGHIEAAGIKIDVLNWNRFINNLKRKDFKQLEVKKYDFELSFEDISKKLAENVKFLNRITGKDFPLIKFKLSNIMIDKIQILKDKHIKFEYNEVIFLKWKDISLFEKYKQNNNLVLEVIGELTLNKFAGQTSIQFVIDEITKIDTLNFRI
jgi:single-stranded-DNA-specific exonuclease